MAEPSKLAKKAISRQNAKLKHKETKSRECSYLAMLTCHMFGCWLACNMQCNIHVRHVIADLTYNYYAVPHIIISVRRPRVCTLVLPLILVLEYTQQLKGERLHINYAYTPMATPPLELEDRNREKNRMNNRTKTEQKSALLSHIFLKYSYIDYQYM